MDLTGSKYTLMYQEKTVEIYSALPGPHNISNQMAATGLCLAAGLDLDTIAQGLSQLKTVPGRLETIPWEGPFTVLIDYAHTDDALHNVLSTLRPLCEGRLWVIFGCGGDRDKSKRPRMARAAEAFADRIIVTSDNPRSEPPRQIIDDIVQGFTSDTETHIDIEPDRRQAINLALQQAQANDTVLICGKGHETFQVIGDQVIPFSDKEIALACLNVSTLS
jgi:UDP-N-acetylmuramoyl-L-alanyl-D-glutamate--2,6-diaminopimelate ligase